MSFRVWIWILPLCLLWPLSGRSELSLDGLGHLQAGEVPDPSVPRQSSVPAGNSSLASIISSCSPSRAGYGAQGGYGGSDGLGVRISPQGATVDSDPVLARGGIFTAAQVNQSLIGLDGKTGRCAKCHNTGTPKPLINAAFLDTPAGRAKVLAALTTRTPPMPKDNPGFASTPEGQAVILFLSSQTTAQAP